MLIADIYQAHLQVSIFYFPLPPPSSFPNLMELMMRSFLLPLTDPPLDLFCVRVSLELAERLDAHVTALLAPLDFSCLPALAHYPAAPGWDELVEQTRLVAERRERDILGVLDELHTSAADDDLDPLSLRVIPGHEVEVVSDCAITHDVVLFPRKTRSEAPRLTANSVLKSTLKNSGRPVLVLTDGLPETFGRVVAIGWNGSVEAARAVTASLPLLGRAERVVIISFVSCDTGASKAEDLRRYLSRYHISAEVQVHDAGCPLGPSLLRAANDVAADLLVMGAYTRSRVGQTQFGAVTHHILENASMPLLMAS